MNRKLGINCECIKGHDPIDNLNLIHGAGFETYFTDKYHLTDAEPIREKGTAIGLECEFIHAPFDEVNSMWYKTDEHPNIYIKMCESIDTAAALAIPSVILHVSSGNNPPEINDKGLRRYDMLVERAAKRGVSVSFENLRRTGIVTYLLDRYRDFSNVSFCYDIGHEHCHTPSVDWIGIANHTLRHTQIHDNIGKTADEKIHDDLHLLPFDGNIDYENKIALLDKCGYTGSLMLEVFTSSAKSYQEIDAEAFVALAYERAKRLNDLSR